MKSKYPSIFGLLLILMLVVSLLPVAKPDTVEASPGTLYWETLSTPSYYPAAGWILKSPSNVDRIAIGSDGATFYAVDIGASAYTDNTTGAQVLYKSTNAGITWSDKISKYLYSAMKDAGQLVGGEMWVWDVVVAPDDPNFVAVVTNDNTDKEPVNVWISTNGGTSWMNTSVPAAATNPSNDLVISAIDISPSYAGGLGTTHDIAIGTRNPDGAAAGEIYMVSYPIGVGAWKGQDLDTTAGGATGDADVLAIKFSPSYAGDFCLAVVSATTANTYLNVGFHNTIANTTVWNTQIGPHFTGYPVEVAVTTNASPGENDIFSADLELVSDWNGDDPRSRKAFVSLDVPLAEAGTADVFRFDDTIVYDLNVPVPVIGTDFVNKRIASIAYYGTSTSGKLLAGERLGNQCSATVQSWISLDPLACPGVCWTSSSKPQTGGAGTNCTDNYTYGNMMVAWSPDGTRAFGGTSNAWMDEPGDSWDLEAYAGPWGDEPKDESAFCITRNDNLTWNQLSLIDTWVSKWTDVAPAADCSVLFAASVNINDTPEADNKTCAGFDSVWRTPNFDKAGTALGSTWERVLCKATTDKACAADQSNWAILRLAPDKTNGSMVFWAAGGNDDKNSSNFEYGSSQPVTVTVDTPNTKAVMWSEDSGDLWYPIRPNLEVQDMAAESSTVLYILDVAGKVQKLTYARPNWKVSAPVDTGIGSGKSIAAMATGNVLVGPMDGGWTAYSADSGATWGTVSVPISGSDRQHVAFDPKFNDNKTFYVGDEGAKSVFRWVWGTSTLWADLNPNNKGKEFEGVALANEGTLYAAWNEEAAAQDSGVDRTLHPTRGTPKPGLEWSTLTYGLDKEVDFTLQPGSLKLCGCLTPDTYTTLYAIDNAAYAGWDWDNNPYEDSGYAEPTGYGYIWMYTDCLAKKGPVISGPDLVGCDPVSGRNQEINLTWEQPCLAEKYDILIAKDEGFTMVVWSESGYKPGWVLSPALVIPAGGGGSDIPLECGHTYYWMVRVEGSALEPSILSPWSEAKSFQIKAGLPVTTPYIGPMVLSPLNGATGVPIKGATFSWTTFKDSSEYYLQLSETPDMLKIIADVKVPTTAYTYDGTLKYNTNYYWQVRANKPVPSDWSPVFSFLTEKEPPPPPPPAPPPPPPPPTPMWVWIVIAIGAILVIVTLILIVRTRRV